MPAAKERDMNDETEQRERVMAWAHEAQRIREQGDRHDAESYANNHLPDTMELIAVLLAQEEENAEQRTLLERWSEAWSSKDRRYPYPETRAHLRGTKAGWSEVLGILNDGSTPRETLEEVTQKFIDDETERRAEADELEPLELNRRQCNASNSTVGGDPAGRLDLANAIFLNDMAHQIENRDADVVAAIAALTAGQYRIEEEDRQQRDLWSKQQEKIDALTEAVLLLGTEVAIPKRKRETTIALGKLRKNGGE
jgi:hypothetical protein